MIVSLSKYDVFSMERASVAKDVGNLFMQITADFMQTQLYRQMPRYISRSVLQEQIE